MKKHILVLALLQVTLLYPQSKMDINNLIERDGLLYTLNDNKPYTGKVFSFNEKGHKESEMTYKDGKQDGKLTFFYENGQKELEETYKDGKNNGLSISWYESGQKWTIGTYKDGKKDGKWTYWHENGQKYSEGIYKVGNVISEKCWDEVGNEKDCVNTY